MPLPPRHCRLLAFVFGIAMRVPGRAGSALPIASAGDRQSRPSARVAARRVRR